MLERNLGKLVVVVTLKDAVGWDVACVHPDPAQ